MKNKKTAIFCLCFLILLHAPLCISQNVECTNLQLTENIMCSKIAWVKDGKTCLVTDKSFSGNKFTHQIFLFNNKGALAQEPLKIKTAYSCQNNYCFTLGTTFYFLEDSHD